MNKNKILSGGGKKSDRGREVGERGGKWGERGRKWGLGTPCPPLMYAGPYGCSSVTPPLVSI